ncbi:hypothetical protein Slin15195_G123880 [Septoria linicola]|uniref:Transcription factor domain-containing protein n=1 Tax=Septoria linicola TaxID=215465 RepID=A0A9Q9EQR4_9PEZI|nr:hypothetical protein Slin14017_G080080 [Septoria linicola]USW59069.1 hypothetical protein Slin15195_G123880 [Septoria linicola]
MAWRHISQHYTNFESDETFFEGLCLLAQADFADGRMERAQAQVAYALSVVQSRGWLVKDALIILDGTVIRQQNGIVWTLFMLDRVFSGHTKIWPTVPASSFLLLLHQAGPTLPDTSQRLDSSARLSMATVSFDESVGMLSITAVNIELLCLWQDVVRFIFQDTQPTSVPLWSDGSSRSKIVISLLDLEPRMKGHSYTITGSPKQANKNPSLRPYFLSWLFHQILHSAMYCCLNHPFLVLSKTRYTRGRLPLTFLQKSYHDCFIHSNWIVRHITEMEKDLRLVDPFIAHLVAIAATVQLEHTLSKDKSIASAARRRFQKCREYLIDMAKIWPNVSGTISQSDDLASRLQHRGTIRMTEKEYDGAMPPHTTENLSLSDHDSQIMWKLFGHENFL